MYIIKEAFGAGKAKSLIDKIETYKNKKSFDISWKIYGR